MHIVTLEGKLEPYRKVCKAYQELMSRGGIESAALSDNLPEAVRQYKEEVFKYLNPITKTELEEMPAYSGLASKQFSQKELAELRIRIGSIVFKTKKEESLVSVPVRVCFSGKDLEFLFEKSSEETANEITGALINKKPLRIVSM